MLWKTVFKSLFHCFSLSGITSVKLCMSHLSDYLLSFQLLHVWFLSVTRTERTIPAEIFPLQNKVREAIPMSCLPNV